MNTTGAAVIDRVRAVDTAGAGRDRLAADHAVVDHAVLVAQPDLAPAAAQEDPGLVGVERVVGVGLELDRARHTRGRSARSCRGRGRGPRCRCGSRGRGDSVGSSCAIVLLATERLEPREARDRRGRARRRASPRPHSAEPGSDTRGHAGADDRGRAQQDLSQRHRFISCSSGRERQRHRPIAAGSELVGLPKPTASRRQHHPLPGLSPQGRHTRNRLYGH